MELTYYVAMSLDGYIAAPGDDLAWLPPMDPAGEDYGYGAFYAGIDAVLLGRRTWEVCRALGDWLYAGKPARVFSRRPPPAAVTPDTVFTAQDPAAVLAALAAGGCRHAFLVGGGELASACQAQITQYAIAVIPVLLGDGTPLFAPRPMTPRPLRLLRSAQHAGGVVMLWYRAEPAP